MNDIKLHQIPTNDSTNCLISLTKLSSKNRLAERFGQIKKVNLRGLVRLNYNIQYWTTY